MKAAEQLIEKFQGRFAIYNDQTFIFDLTIDEISEIIAGLSALRTLRGIEGLMKEGSAPEFYIADNGEYVCSMTKNYYGDTFADCVEAAGAEREGGEQ